MASYPNNIYSPREKKNRAGIEYIPEKKTVIFVEDIKKLDEEVVAIQTELGLNFKRNRLDPNLCLYLPFEEGVGTKTKDLSGWGNHGTLVNGPSWTTGKVGGCLSFDGTDDYVNCGNNTILCPANGQITIEFWMNPSIDLTSGTGSKFLVSYAWGWTEIFYSDGKLYWEVYDESHNKYSKTLSYTFPKNTWYHIAAVLTGFNNTMYLYINGSQNNLGNSLSSYDLVYENLYLGKSGSYYWSGLIDEFRVYSRVLSASEIQDHYLHP